MMPALKQEVPQPALCDKGIGAVILDPASLAPTPFSSVLKTPQRHLRFGPHIDYQLNANNYFSLRYTLTRATIQDAGIGGFDLIPRGYYRLNTFNTVQFIETTHNFGQLTDCGLYLLQPSVQGGGGLEIQIGRGLVALPLDLAHQRLAAAF